MKPLICLRPALLNTRNMGLWLVLLMAALPTFAQQLLTGSVADMRTGAFLNGVSLTVANTPYGTISTNTGSFRINASNVTFPAEVTVSRSGYETKTVRVENAIQPLRITLLKTGENVRDILPMKGTAAEYHAKLEVLKTTLAQIQWSAAPTNLASKTEYVLAIAGYNPFDIELFSLQGIRIYNLPVVVHFIDPATLTASNLPDAILISQPDKKVADNLSKLLWGTSVLTIGDRCEGTTLKTVLTFSYTEPKAQLSVNKALAALAGISFSPTAPNVLVVE